MGISSAFIFILAATAVMLGPQMKVNLFRPGWVLPSAILICLAFIFTCQYFTMKHSEVLTAPGLVVFRRRKLFAGPERVFFIVYTIKSVRSVAGGAKRPNSGFQGVSGSIFVIGDIEISYVYEDGREVSAQKSRRRILIPSCFTAMSAIYSTLENMRR